MEEDKLPEVGLVPNSCCVTKNPHFLIASLCNYNNFQQMKGPFRESVMKRESTILRAEERLHSRVSSWSNSSHSITFTSSSSRSLLLSFWDKAKLVSLSINSSVGDYATQVSTIRSIYRLHSTFITNFKERESDRIRKYRKP